MSPRYLFPCPKCEHQFEIVTQQAGQELECPECQQRSEVPILGKIRQLDSVDGSIDGSVGKPAGRDSGRGLKNYLFAGGLGIAILAGVAGGFLYQYASSMIFELDVAGTMDGFDEWVDELTPAQIVEYYAQMNVADGLGDWQEQPHIGYTKQGKILRNFSYGLCGLSGLGLLMMIGSFMIRR